MGTESVPEMSGNLHILKRLFARENFIGYYVRVGAWNVGFSENVSELEGVSSSDGTKEALNQQRITAMLLPTEKEIDNYGRNFLHTGKSRQQSRQ